MVGGKIKEKIFFDALLNHPSAHISSMQAVLFIKPIKYCGMVAASKKAEMGNRKYFSFEFLHHDISCNITQQLIKTN